MSIKISTYKSSSLSSNQRYDRKSTVVSQNEPRQSNNVHKKREHGRKYTKRTEVVEEQVDPRFIDEDSIDFMYRAARQIIADPNSLQTIEVAFGIEAPIRSVHIDGTVVARSGEKRQFTIVFEYDYVTIGETMIVADVRVPMNEFVRQTSFDSVEQARKFIESAANWVRNHDTCDAFVVGNCTDVKWEIPNDIGNSVDNLHRAANNLNAHGYNLAVVMGAKMFIYDDSVNIIYSRGVIRGCYYVTEFQRPATFETVMAAEGFLKNIIGWMKMRDTCVAFMARELPEMEFE